MVVLWRSVDVLMSLRARSAALDTRYLRSRDTCEGFDLGSSGSHTCHDAKSVTSISDILLFLLYLELL